MTPIDAAYIAYVIYAAKGFIHYAYRMRCEPRRTRFRRERDASSRAVTHRYASIRINAHQRADHAPNHVPGYLTCSQADTPTPWTSAGVQSATNSARIIRFLTANLRSERSQTLGSTNIRLFVISSLRTSPSPIAHEVYTRGLLRRAFPLRRIPIGLLRT